MVATFDASLSWQVPMVPSPVPSEMAVNLGRGSAWNATVVLFHNGERVNSGGSGIGVLVKNL
jgi:hypothetical protein